MNTPINDGGPAFPCIEEDTSGGIYETGMSLRDWFAGQALAGLLSNPSIAWKATVYAEEARLIADAMIASRNQQPEKP